MWAEGTSNERELILNLASRGICFDDVSFHREIIYLALWDQPGEDRRQRTVLGDPMVGAIYPQ